MLLADEVKLLLHDPRDNVAVQDGSQAHIFTFATRCYWHMLRERENQVVVMSGESGSGKTTQAHWLMR